MPPRYDNRCREPRTNRNCNPLRVLSLGSGPPCAGPAAREGRHRGGRVRVRVTGRQPVPGRKPLKLGLDGLHSARRGDYLVIYRIDDQHRRVDVVAIEHRSDIYRLRQF
jgi:mRNA-degrading endonuclease RelE of RelBE toxin-antitoxin system